MASFGNYEVYGGKYKEPIRFNTAQELLNDLLENEPKWFNGNVQKWL